MIKRIVRLSFRHEEVENFLAVFERSKVNISNFEGCYHLELLRDKQHSNVFFTYSFWENEAALNRYRQSPFFQDTWQQTKALFNDKPKAWSLELVDEVKSFYLK